jgi:hypothetical protein
VPGISQPTHTLPAAQASKIHRGTCGEKEHCFASNSPASHSPHDPR